jgi:molybdopterin-guanine dinucleotide biosynthesis protein A
MSVETELLGVVLAGGESTRFGSPKALATFRGRPMGARALDALESRFSKVVMVANDPLISRELGVSARPDLDPGLGPLGGLVTALHWGRELGVRGVFLLACDLPLVGEAMVGGILSHGFGEEDILLPQSPGPLGVEPLCGAYLLGCLPSATALLQGGRRSMMGLLEEVGYTMVPMERLGGEDALSMVFRNVNSPRDIRALESWNSTADSHPLKPPKGAQAP